MSGATGAVMVEEAGLGAGPEGREHAGPLRCCGCVLWPRQQTWLCVVPLLMGLVGLGLSLMLLRWIVAGTVRDSLPTDLLDMKSVGQDPIFLSRPSVPPENGEPTVASTLTSTGGRSRVRLAPPISTTARAGPGAFGSQVTPRSTTTTITMATPTTATPSSPTVLHDSTLMWTQSPASERPPATPTWARRTPPATSPSLHSEHWKPCRDKDLSYCLNEGECFIVETLTGVHKHCRCKEGYQGVRCDQFLPKTDSILPDSKDHLGIEFMETAEVYQRQVLSISCIASSISLLGTICMALYCHSKRNRDKLHAKFQENCSRKNCKSQLHKSFKDQRLSPYELSSDQQSIRNNRLCTAKHNRPGQRSCHLHSSSLHKSAPISGSRMNPIGCRECRPGYHHQKEAESSPKEVEPHHREHRAGSCGDLERGSTQTLMQTRIAHSSLGHASLPSLRPASIPIIPSVQGPQGHGRGHTASHLLREAQDQLQLMTCPHTHTLTHTQD